MYYFIIPIMKSYQILWKLHFLKCVLHFKMYNYPKFANFAFDITKRKRNGLKSNTEAHPIHIIYNIIYYFKILSFTI